MALLYLPVQASFLCFAALTISAVRAVNVALPADKGAGYGLEGNIEFLCYSF
jgi:hypothetical protein